MAEQQKCDHRGYLVPMVCEIKDFMKPGSALAPGGPEFMTRSTTQVIQCIKCEAVFKPTINVEKLLAATPKMPQGPSPN